MDEYEQDDDQVTTTDDMLDATTDLAIDLHRRVTNLEKELKRKTDELRDLRYDLDELRDAN